MLKLHISAQEAFNSDTNTFVDIKEQTLTLEHSLVSVSRWESKWHIPFFAEKREKTKEEIRDYIRCMTISQNVNPEIYYLLSAQHLNQILAYIDDPMTATWFNSDDQNRPIRRGEVITSEIIYYWMVQFGIPFECQKWHLNRLLTLINVCGEKSRPQKKMSKRALAKRYSDLNEIRKRKLNTKG